MCYAYRDRKVKKEISVLYGFNVSTLELDWKECLILNREIEKLNIELNRKVLADLAMNHPDAQSNT
jgi:large subunit ribosomal protein L20